MTRRKLLFVICCVIVIAVTASSVIADNNDNAAMRQAKLFSKIIGTNFEDDWACWYSDDRDLRREVMYSFACQYIKTGDDGYEILITLPWEEE